MIRQCLLVLVWSHFAFCSVESLPAQSVQSGAAIAVQHLRANQDGAYQEVIAAGPRAIDGLAQMLVDYKLTVELRFTAANALGEIGSKKAVKPLLNALNDREFNVRRCAALALGKIGDPTAKPALERLAKQDKFVWKDETGKARYLVREDAQEALRNLAAHSKADTSDPQSTAKVAESAEPPTVKDASAAIEHFRNNQPGAYEDLIAIGESAVDGLSQMLFDKKLSVQQRFMAANALGDIKSHKAVKPLLKAIKDPEFNVRRCAALALGKIGDKSVRPALEKLAREDAFAWTDPDSKTVRYLVREDAKQALRILSGEASPSDDPGLKKQPEKFLNDASKLPTSPIAVPAKKLPWPFPGSVRDQNIWNNYQQPTDIYVHAGLDMLQSPGTEVRAVDDGYVATVFTNYPDWKTHHFFIVTNEKNGNEGWCYTHVDPDSYTFKIGDKISQGQVLGKVVDFYVGKNKGADHLHLHYVSFETDKNNKVLVESLADPLQFFEWEDSAPPQIHEPLRFVHKGSLDEFSQDSNHVPAVSGKVEIVAGISDNGYENQPCNWMVPVITLEISGENSAPWRKLVLDQRGPVATSTKPTALYLTANEALRWTKGAPRFPTVYFVKATSTDGNGVIEADDRLQAWDTSERDEQGKQRFPNGMYTVTVRAWDLGGNGATRSAKVKVDNKSETSS